MNRFFEALMFPAGRQDRGAAPGPFTDPRSYKPHLRRTFQRKCVYCRTPDGFKGAESFGVDHYLPKSKFPQLAIAWSNLFYACNRCNAWKGEYVSTPELFLPNPCDHRMSDHLQYSGAEIDTYTVHGEWLKELLNLDGLKEIREIILSALANSLRTRNELVKSLTFFEARLDTAHTPEEQGVLQAAIRDTAAELERVDGHIELLTGERVGIQLI